jgi:uncharacterized OB-fold protein
MTALLSTPRQPGTAPFQKAAERGILMIPRCRNCEKTHWYPRPVCPRCFSDEIEWDAACGMGKIYSYTVMRRAKPPYTLAYVTLDEGPTMMTRIVNCDFDSVKIGMRVKVLMQADDAGTHVPVFEPA